MIDARLGRAWPDHRNAIFVICPSIPAQQRKPEPLILFERLRSSAHYQRSPKTQRPPGRCGGGDASYDVGGAGAHCDDGVFSFVWVVLRGGFFAGDAGVEHVFFVFLAFI